MRRVIAGVFLLAYFLLLLRHNCTFASGPDSSGYVAEAKLFASGKLSVPVEPLRELGADPSLLEVFVPLGFHPGPNGTMVPTYPPGLPLHMLLFALIGGWSVAPFLVAPLAAIGCLVLMYGVARELGVSRDGSVLAPILLAPTAVFLAFAMQPMSDVVATFWILLAFWCALRERFAFAGAALAIAVAVRPTNALALLPLALAVPLHVRAWRNVILGALVPSAALLALNHVQYGSPFRFGFASVADVLTLSPPGVCGVFHLEWTMRMLTPIAVVLAIAMLFVRAIPMRRRLLLASWFAVFLAFYSFYDYCPNWTAIRFLLPAFPAVIVAALLTLERIAQTRGRAARVIAAILVLAILAGEIDQTSEFRVFRVDDHESVFPETVAWANRLVPPDALVVTGVFSGAFYVDGRWTVRWDRLDADRFMRLRAYAGNRAWYAVISDGEGARLPGTWTPIGRNRDVTLYRLDA